MHRLFVACIPAVEERRTLLDIMGGLEGARWQTDQQLHLTTRFIGDVDSSAAERIADHLAGLRARRFDLSLNGVGYFEKRGKAHTLWAGIAPAEPAAALHRKIDRALVSLGLPPEQRAYRPHITIARLALPVVALSPFLQAHAGLTSASYPVERLALFESLPTAEGRVYQPVVSIPLD